MREFIPHRGNRASIDLDDLLQEARIVFLNHLRQIPDESTIMYCRFAIHGALCELCRRMSLIKIPKYCYQEEIDKIHSVDIDDVVWGADECCVMDVDTMIEVRKFMDTLTERERTVCKMKQKGYTNREIIPFVGVAGEPQMSRLWKSVKIKAGMYFSECGAAL